MNIFLPYENDIRKSVESLDDLRLNKQILEIYQLLRLSIDESKSFDISERGYRNHPIYLHYKNNKKFLIDYGFKCCKEYSHRFNKVHKLYSYFTNSFFKYDGGKGGWFGINHFIWKAQKGNLTIFAQLKM